MWHSIKPWLGWVLNEAVPAARARYGRQSLTLSFEKAGQVLQDARIPWNADAVVLEVDLRLPHAARQKNQFALRVPGQPIVPVELLRKDDTHPNRYRLVFRFQGPAESCQAEVMWKHHLLATVPLDVISKSEFLSRITLANPTISVHLAGHCVAAQSYVAKQCRGVLASAVLRSPTLLAPLVDMETHVRIQNLATGAIREALVTFNGTQLTSKEALVNAIPAAISRRSGRYRLDWCVGSHSLGSVTVQALRESRFVQSLHMVDARFIVCDPQGKPRLTHQAPLGPHTTRIGPCFILQSREIGVAGLVDLQVAAVRSPGEVPLAVLEQQVLISDGPTLFTPGLLEGHEMQHVHAFELRQGARVLGQLSLYPVPTAAFTSEGGYQLPAEFVWTPSAEDDLSERLSRLMQVDQHEKPGS